MFDFFILLLLIFRDLSTSFEWTYIEYIRKVSNSAARVKKKNTNRIRCIFLSLSWLLTFIQKCKKFNTKNIFFEGYIRPSIIDPLLTRKQPCLFIQKKIYSFAGFDISLLLFFLQNGIGCIGAVALQSLPHTSCVYIESSSFFPLSEQPQDEVAGTPLSRRAASLAAGSVSASRPSVRPFSFHNGPSSSLERKDVLEPFGPYLSHVGDVRLLPSLETGQRRESGR